MSEHLPECVSAIRIEALDSSIEEMIWTCMTCEALLKAEQRVLNKVIERAELTFRSDIINPVRDIIEPMLEDK